MKPDIHYLPRAHLQALIDALHAAGFRCVGPQAADGAIVYDTLTEVAQLPWGITQTQAPGHYRLHASDDARCFAWADGPQALRPLWFAQGHSQIHGITIRAETPQRYRQWLTHKLGSWHEQYGRSGCVGCGRCIAWCPVGIDLTEEATVICGDVVPQ